MRDGVAEMFGPRGDVLKRAIARRPAPDTRPTTDVRVAKGAVPARREQSLAAS
jgi:hypothetical protein